MGVDGLINETYSRMCKHERMMDTCKMAENEAEAERHRNEILFYEALNKYLRELKYARRVVIKYKNITGIDKDVANKISKASRALKKAVDSLEKEFKACEPMDVDYMAGLSLAIAILAECLEEIE